mmetsp:Transcript_54130/g.162048  ORF Transcript_54130/g.162048 Transcript_54130/m.162048 type:complete len:208 (+) Transcript_54130:293-916(+)
MRHLRSPSNKARSQMDSMNSSSVISAISPAMDLRKNSLFAHSFAMSFVSFSFFSSRSFSFRSTDSTLSASSFFSSSSIQSSYSVRSGFFVLCSSHALRYSSTPFVIIWSISCGLVYPASRRPFTNLVSVALTSCTSVKERALFLPHSRPRHSVTRRKLSSLEKVAFDGTIPPSVPKSWIAYGCAPSAASDMEPTATTVKDFPSASSA